LFQRILGEGLSAEPQNNRFEFFSQFLQVFGGQFGICLGTAFRLEFRQDVFKGFVRQAQNHRTEHLDQAAVGIIHKPLVVGEQNHAAGGLVIETDI